jgi:hypothetical protein
MAIDKLPYPKEIIPADPKAAYQDPDVVGLRIGLSEPGKGTGDTVWRHEYGHHIDFLVGQAKGVKGGFGDRGYISGSPAGRRALSRDNKTLRAQKKAADSLSSNELFAIDRKIDEIKFDVGGKKYKQLLESSPAIFREMDSRMKQYLPREEREESIATAILTGNPGDFIQAAEKAVAASFQGQRPLHVADLAGAVTANAVGYGHSSMYYQVKAGSQETEAFANAFTLLSSGDALHRDIAERLAPNVVKFVLDTLDGV